MILMLNSMCLSPLWEQGGASMPGDEQDFGAQSLGYLLFSLGMDFARKKAAFTKKFKSRREI